MVAQHAAGFMSAIPATPNPFIEGTLYELRPFLRYLVWNTEPKACPRKEATFNDSQDELKYVNSEKSFLQDTTINRY